MKELLMPTKKRRVNITLPHHVDEALQSISERDGVPLASKALELLKSAIEIEEDTLLQEIAQERDTEHASLSHDETWS
jgi:hypothetical protein